MPMASRAQDDRAAEACLEGLTISGLRRRPERVKLLLLEFLEEVKVAALRCERVPLVRRQRSKLGQLRIGVLSMPRSRGHQVSVEHFQRLHSRCLLGVADHVSTA